MTGAQNTRFIARFYGVDTDELLDYVKDFSELGTYFYTSLRSYSAGKRSRLTFWVSFGIPFDTYLVDEVACACAIAVTHSTAQLRKLCQAGAVLENGKLTYFDDVEDAVHQHQFNMISDEDG